MNFVGPDVILKLASSHGLGQQRAPNPEVTTLFNTFIFHVLRAALDAVRVVAKGATLQAKDFESLARLRAMLTSPVASGPGRSQLQRGGHAGTVMAAAFFDAAQDAPTRGYLDAAPSALQPEPGMIRGALHSTFPGQSGGASSWFGEGDSLARDALRATFPHQSGGSAFKCWLTEDALAALVKEYKSRRSCTIKLSESAVQQLRAIVVLNVHNALGSLQKVHKAKSLTASKLRKVSQSWTLCLA
jgi:hypothetical protein